MQLVTGQLSATVTAGSEQEGFAALAQALAACTVQRMDILHERLLHMTCSCREAKPAPRSDSLAASTESVAAAAAETAAKAQASRVDTDVMLREQATDELDALTGALLRILNLAEELRSMGRPGIPCIGQLAKQSFIKMLTYAQRPGERLRFLIMMQKAAAAREQACAVTSAQQGKQTASFATGLQRPAAPCRAGAAQDESLSLAAAAQQMLKGNELWEDSQAAHSLQAAVNSLLLGPARDMDLLFTVDEAAISVPSSQKLQASIIRRFPAEENGNRHDIATHSKLGTGGDTSAKDMTANKRMQNQARSASDAQQAQRAADSLKLDRGAAGAAAASEVFALLNRMPLQWPALHVPAARHLLGLSLGFHKLVLRALEAARTQSEASRAAAGTGSEPAPAMPTFVSSATALSGSVLSFIARLAASGGKGLADDLACVSADSGLDWPYFAADAAARELPVPLPGTAPGPQPVQAQDRDVALISQAAAAVMYHSSRHALISQCSPTSEEKATRNGTVQALEAWAAGMRQSLQPGRPAWQLGSSRPQQLEVVCAALRSAAALAMPPTSTPAQRSSADTAAGAHTNSFGCHCFTGMSPLQTHLSLKWEGSSSGVMRNACQSTQISLCLHK